MKFFNTRYPPHCPTELRNLAGMFIQTGSMFSIFIIVVTFSACIASYNQGDFTITEGITGRLLWKEGNFMPSPNRPNASEGVPIERELAIYKVANMNQAKVQGVFFSDIRTELVKKVKSTKSGFFQVKLPPGKYSVFSVEPKGLFANRFDGKGNINVVEIEPSTVTNIVFIIDYKAAY